MQKLFTETKKLFLNPVAAATGAIETASEWTSSRKWMRILPVLPLGVAVIGIYVFAAVRDSAGDQQQIRAYFETMDAEYPLTKLETILYRDHLKIGNKPLDYDMELLSASADNSSSNALASRRNTEPVSSVEPPSQAILQKFAMILDRLKQVSETNNDVLYRDAVITALQGNLSEAEKIIEGLVNSNGIQLPSANHWQAVRLLNERINGGSVSDAQLGRVLANAVDWRTARPMIKVIYSDQLWSQQKYDRSLELMLSAANRCLSSCLSRESSESKQS